MFRCSRLQNFEQIHIDRVCRQQMKYGSWVEFLYELVENVVGKGENPGNQHVLHFPQCFQSALRMVETGDYLVKK